MQVWGGDVSQDHLLGQTRREPRRWRKPTAGRWFRRSIFGRGQSMVSLSVKVSFTARSFARIPTSKCPSLASMRAWHLVTPDRGTLPSSQRLPASSGPRITTQSLWRFPAGPPGPLFVGHSDQLQLWPALSPGSTGNPFSSQRLPFRPIKISDFECQRQGLAVSMFTPFLPQSSHCLPMPFSTPGCSPDAQWVL